MPLMMSLAVRGDISAMTKNNAATPRAPQNNLFNLLPFLVGVAAFSYTHVIAGGFLIVTTASAGGRRRQRACFRCPLVPPAFEFHSTAPSTPRTFHKTQGPRRWWQHGSNVNQRRGQPACARLGSAAAVGQAGPNAAYQYAQQKLGMPALGQSGGAVTFTVRFVANT